MQPENFCNLLVLYVLQLRLNYSSFEGHHTDLDLLYYVVCEYLILSPSKKHIN